MSVNVSCYPLESEGYTMSKGEQHTIYLGLKDQRKNILNEIAALEADMKASAVLFSSLVRSLNDCQAANLDWVRYKSLTSELPLKANRHAQLKLDLAGVQAQLDKFVGFD